MTTYHHYSLGRPPIERPRAKTMEEVQAQIDGFLRKHPIPENIEKTRRLDAILFQRKLDKAAP